MSDGEPNVEEGGQGSSDGLLRFGSDYVVPQGVEHPRGRRSDGVGQFVSRELLAGALDDYANELRTEEQRLAPEVPGGQPQGIHRDIARASEELRGGERTMRALPAVNVYARVADVPIGGGLTETLLALDAKVNAIDDIVDTPDLDWERKVHLMVVTAFSDVLALERLPPEHVADVGCILRRYWTEIAQIPVVERRLRDRMRSVSAPEDRFEAARSIYEYRARDIKAFAQLPAVGAGLDDEAVEYIVRDLQAFRARFLLFEDFRHLTRDARVGHENPVMVLARAVPDRESLADIVYALLARFRYSTWSRGRYAMLLEELERQPDDIEARVSAFLETLNH